MAQTARLIVVESGLPVIGPGEPSGIRLPEAGLIAPEVPAVVDRVAGALDFLRDQSIPHGPIAAGDVRVRRDPETLQVAGIEFAISGSDAAPTADDDVRSLAQLVHDGLGALVGPEANAVLVEALGQPSYPDSRTLAARIIALSVQPSTHVQYTEMHHQAMGQQPVAGPPTPWPGQPAPSARRGRRGLIIATVIGAVVLLVGGTIAGLMLTRDSDDGPSAAGLPRQEYLLANPDGVDVGSWTAVSVADAMEDSLPTICAVSDNRVFCRSRWSSMSTRKSEGSVDPEQVTKVDDINDVTSVSVGEAACAVTGGKAACWGGTAGLNGAKDADGRSGIVSGLGNVTAVAAAQRVVCAVSDGSVWCWGDATFSDDYETRPDVPPLVVPGLAGVTDIAVDDSHACAIAGQRAYCWGSDKYGAIGMGLNGRTRADTPEPVKRLGAVSAIAVAGQHSCAISAGQVYCWGTNFGAPVLGFPVEWRQSPEPGLVPGLTGATAIAAADDHTCAVVRGSVWCWGENRDGQLGTGNLTPSPEPVQVPGLTQVTAISATKARTCVVNAGNLYCWGRMK
ncbi:hypothetical protein QSJ18_13350 [Gordonia sp. ABSL1-1]|uniref:RCC1 domain-containing protein n=1 Tax=Gordonia sp. ABSL1-1 TaxID=3053923 RepID=UPI0025748818|nr:hypothetical protein [Gordonia sp. ABSL1-1]MDL9937733.1 hypothetical protein [Gordonia sp. ABSL1-1]